VALVVIDDHEQWRDGLVRALAAGGHPIQLAYVGAFVEEGIAAAPSSGPALALLDAHRADGSANVAAVRALQQHAIPIAIMTAQAEAGTVRALIAAGAFACIQKGDVLTCLDELIRAAATGVVFPTPQLTACLLPVLAEANLSAAQCEALHWHATGVGRAAILHHHRLNSAEFDSAVAYLVARLRDGGHGASTSSSSTRRD